MAKYKKKPIIIEAIQFNNERSIYDMETRWGYNFIAAASYSTPITTVSIDTLDGNMKVSPGDWVIRGVNGEFYPCKHEIFEKTYELVEE